MPPLAVRGRCAVGDSGELPARIFSGGDQSKIFTPASTIKQSTGQIDAWLASPQAHILHSGLQHWQILSELAVKAKLQGGQFHDARIAAVCIENGVSVLWSADRDFGRFKALKTVNPLV